MWDFDSLLSHDLNGATGGTESAAESPADVALDEFGSSFDDKLAGGGMMADEDDADYDSWPLVAPTGSRARPPRGRLSQWQWRSEQ